jgi:multidrug efflux pump subunit AcrB
VAQVYSGGRVIDVAVSAQASLRRDPEAVGNLLLRSSSGFSVPLKRVAEVYLTDGAARIAHDNGLPREEISVAARAPGFAGSARAALARIKPPAGVYFEVQDANAAEGFGAPLAAGYALALFAVAILLAVAFDPRTGALMLASAALALAGGVAAAALMGAVLSIGVVAGLIALFGLSLRHAILLTDRLDAMVLHERAPWSWETVRKAARERFAPILTTSVLIALALIPFALHAGAPGREVLGPMSIVILGGLVTSVLGSLIVLPVLTHLFWRPAYGRRARRAETPAPKPNA